MASDTLVYMFLKSICHSQISICHILMLSSNVGNSSTLRDMIGSVVKLGGITITITLDDGTYSVSFKSSTLSFNNYSQDIQSVVDLLHSVKLVLDCSIVVFPEVTDEYFRTIRLLQPTSWCVPSYPHSLYVSELGKEYFSHNAYPWSRPLTNCGFTLGHGQIVKGSNRETLDYIGAFNFYHSAISCVPLGEACTDCEYLRVTRDMIVALVDGVRVKHRAKLSSSSVEALEEIRRSLAEAMQSS